MNFIEKHPIIGLIALFLAYFSIDIDIIRAGEIPKPPPSVPNTLESRELTSKSVGAIKVSKGMSLLYLVIQPTPGAVPSTYFDEQVWQKQVDESSFSKKNGEGAYMGAFHHLNKEVVEAGKPVPTDTKWKIPFASVAQESVEQVVASMLPPVQQKPEPPPPVKKWKYVPKKVEL